MLFLNQIVGVQSGPKVCFDFSNRKEGEWNWGSGFVGFFRRGCSRGGG